MHKVAVDMINVSELIFSKSKKLDEHSDILKIKSAYFDIVRSIDRSDPIKKRRTFIESPILDLSKTVLNERRTLNKPNCLFCNRGPTYNNGIFYHMFTNHSMLSHKNPSSEFQPADLFSVVISKYLEYDFLKYIPEGVREIGFRSISKFGRDYLPVIKQREKDDEVREGKQS